MNFLPLRLNSSSVSCSICALAVIILQLVAIETQKLHMVDWPITYGGPIRLLTMTLIRLYLAPSNLVTFYLLLLDTFWQQNFSKINSPGGCCSSFSNETSRKIEHTNFFISQQNHGNAEGVKICARKDAFRHKSDFVEFCSIPGSKY